MPTPTPMLHAAKFEDMIDRRGRAVQWQEAVTCSCWNMDSGQPQYSCKACGGKGFVYQPPIDSKALVTGLTLNQNWEQMAGMFEVGDAVMTVPSRFLIRNDRNIPTGQFTANPMFEIGVNDKVILLDDEFKTSEVLARDLPIGNNAADTLVNERITRLKSVRAYDTDTGVVTDYKLGTDFDLVGNRVNWIDGGNAPEQFHQYTVTYFHRPTYVVVATLPKPRHQDGQDFPRYVALRYMSGAVAR